MDACMNVTMYVYKYVCVYLHMYVCKTVMEYSKAKGLQTSI